MYLALIDEALHSGFDRIAADSSRKEETNDVKDDYLCCKYGREIKVINS